MNFDPKVQRLAEITGVPPVAAQGMRHFLWAFVIDGGAGEDVTEVSTAQWAAALSCKRSQVRELIEAFIEAGFLYRKGPRILVADWEAISNDESMSACRRWIRSKPGGLASLASELRSIQERDDQPSSRVVSLDARREPAVGWPQQEQFLQIIERIDDENDRLVKLLRALRMCVGPIMPLSEEQWETILIAARAVLDMEEYAESRGDLESE